MTFIQRVRFLPCFGMGALSPWLFGCVLDQFTNTTPIARGSAWTLLGAMALVGPWLTWLLLRQRQGGSPAISILAEISG